MNPVVTLISPAAVDGYPPVQAQARLLAEAGYDVRLLTAPRRGRKTVDFAWPGVRVTRFDIGVTRVRNLFAYAACILAITAIRLLHGKRLMAEIAFDPNGMALSHKALGRRPRRIAHFHETLGPLLPQVARIAAWTRPFDLVVVADSGRAPLLATELALPVLPTVVPNYPLSAPPTPAPARNPGFEVVYGGSIDVEQRIDLVIRSVPGWPPQAKLVLLGDDTRPNVQPLKQLVADLGLGERVIFHGWITTDALIERYRSAHLGISLLDPSREQWRLSVGASNKRYQYMKGGLAQIGDRIAGVPELLEDNGIGRVVQDYTPEAIAQIVTDYASDPARVAAEGARAEQLHRERYNYQQAFAPILAWIAEGRR